MYFHPRDLPTAYDTSPRSPHSGFSLNWCLYLNVTHSNKPSPIMFSHISWLFFRALATNWQWHLTAYYYDFVSASSIRTKTSWGLSVGTFVVLGLCPWHMKQSLAHRWDSVKFQALAGSNNTTVVAHVTSLARVVNELWAEVMSINSSSKHQSIYYNLFRRSWLHEGRTFRWFLLP